MVQGFQYSAQGMYPNYGGYSNNPMYLNQQQEVAQQPMKSSNICKNMAKTLGTVAVVSGGLVLANKQGWIKQIENPTKAWDKVQTAMAKSGDGIEKTTLSWYNRIKNFVTKKQNTETIIKNAGLDKTA